MTSHPQWPTEVVDSYEPVRHLGKGSFGSVVLARRKDANDGQLFAVKIVKAGTNTENQYAHREINILKEIDHPNIVKLIEFFEPQDSSFIATMILSYEEGKTLDYLLVNVGAPSLTFCRVVIAQLVYAVSYLHSHAVIHRDIKPDNIIIKNICLTDRSILQDEPIEKEWPELLQKWHLTLIDFGFARALGPKDLEFEEAIKTRIKNVMRDEEVNSIDNPVDDRSKSFFVEKKLKNDNDVSKHFVRALSALGTQTFAAPEVKNKVRSSPKADSSSHKTLNTTLASCVSDYGMIADAFSVGATARFLLTGVPPNENVEEFIANHNNPLNKALRWLRKKVFKKANIAPKKKYRLSSKLPLEALQLVRAMTKPNASLRTSVRDAMRYPYIEDVFEGTTPFKKDITFLQCTQF